MQPDQQRAFDILVRAAIAGERCPQNGTFGIESGVVGALARAGHIKVEISGHNFRRVMILTGEHAGKATKAEPAFRVWKVIDKDGTRVNGQRKLTDSGAANRRPPSMPVFKGLPS